MAADNHQNREGEPGQKASERQQPPVLADHGEVRRGRIPEQLELGDARTQLRLGDQDPRGTRGLSGGRRSRQGACPRP